MRVLVTGATGFLGRRVVTALVDRHEGVVAAVRPGSDSQDLFGLGDVELREADLRNDSLDTLLDGVDVVVHLAAQVVGSDEARFAGTAAATERLLEAVARSEVSRLVLVSSYSVYDWEAARGRLDESSPTLDAPYHRDGYAVAKVWQERLVEEFAASTPVDVVVLRPGFIWGPGREDIAGAGVRLGPVLLVPGPSGRLPLTYVDNCADAVASAAAASAPRETVMNIVDDRGVRRWRYARFLASLDHSLVLTVPIPYAIGRALVGALAFIMPRVFSHGGKLPNALKVSSYVALFRDFEHSPTRAMKELAWSPHVGFRAATSISLRAAQHQRPASALGE